MMRLKGKNSVTDLQAIVYVSSAAHLPSPAEIDHLLERAQARNAQEAVTGVLLYRDGNFLQYLEGPASGLLTIYKIIKADPLHYGIIELLHEPILTRDFPVWSMAFRSANMLPLLHPTQLNEQLSLRLDPAVGPMSTARMLLTKLWNKGRISHGY